MASPSTSAGGRWCWGPLNPAEVGAMLGLEAAKAFDAALVTGGLPPICAECPHGAGLWDFLGQVLAGPVSALLVSAERSLAAEFPPQAQAHAVLSAIGSGERTFSNIAKAASGIPPPRCSGHSPLLTDKRVVTTELPLALRPSEDRRYRVTDSYLHFWLRLLGPSMDEVERGRGDLTLERIQRNRASWRGRAVEPLIRAALARLLPDEQLPAAPAVGGYWTRTNDIEIDLVGADRGPIARELLFLGSVKWMENSPFDRHDLAALTPEALPTVAISRSGTNCTSLDATYSPAELLTAWPT
ncbi:hypothetical protein GCM10027160_51790 [Streptomyces calidiresistens]